ERRAPAAVQALERRPEIVAAAELDLIAREAMQERAADHARAANLDEALVVSLREVPHELAQVLLDAARRAACRARALGAGGEPREREHDTQKGEGDQAHRSRTIRDPPHRIESAACRTR